MDPLPASFVLDVWCWRRLFLKDAMRNLAVPRDNTIMHLLYSNVHSHLLEISQKKHKPQATNFCKKTGTPFYRAEGQMHACVVILNPRTWLLYSVSLIEDCTSTKPLYAWSARFSLKRVHWYSRQPARTLKEKVQSKLRQFGGRLNWKNQKLTDRFSTLHNAICHQIYV